MRDRAQALADTYLPDFVYGHDTIHDLVFVPRNNHIVAQIRQDGRDAYYHFTDWSRHQLLAQMGAKEKWFRHVPRETEAHELNLRLGVLKGQMFRLMAEDPSEDDRVVRGLVSKEYSDIRDILILNQLVEHMPGGQAVRSSSGMSQCAFYTFAVQDAPFEIPNTQLRGFPGMIVRNSEVGFTSLWVVPTLWSPGRRYPVVFEREPLLRRVHRGNVDLPVIFGSALARAKAVWGSLQEKLQALSDIRYPTEDLALGAIEGLVVRAGGMKWMSKAAREAYKRAHHAVHSGEAILQAIMDVVDAEKDPDRAYTVAAIAGAVLIALVT